MDEIKDGGNEITDEQGEDNNKEIPNGDDNESGAEEIDSETDDDDDALIENEDSLEEENKVRRSSRIKGRPTVFTYDAIGGKPVMRYR